MSWRNAPPPPESVQNRVKELFSEAENWLALAGGDDDSPAADEAIRAIQEVGAVFLKAVHDAGVNDA